jgi:hypothetical protein
VVGRSDNVAAHQFEDRVAKHMHDVLPPGREEVVHAQHFAPHVKRRPKRCDPMNLTAPVTNARLAARLPSSILFKGHD